MRKTTQINKEFIMSQQAPTLHQYELPQLPYEFNALEPVISEEIMRIHYTKHHQTYVTNLNKALQEFAEAEEKQDLQKMVALQAAIKFNGGGNINHTIFWTNLAPKDKGGGAAPTGPLADAINKDFGSLQNLIDQMSAKATALQGSGWAWLGYDKANHVLFITTCDNQDPLSTKGLIPLLGIDVWEHAYYLQYKNVRADYVKAIWSIVNWKNVAERFQKAQAK
jgi:superoxide dismutase, Fe-Mn family